jgi:hypothetical protein
MQNRRFIAPKFHERPQPVSPLSAPQPEVVEEIKQPETHVETPVVEDKKTPKDKKQN